ncbi:hypothetical protein V6N13_051953 [Hibiscus sabdariffa]
MEQEIFGGNIGLAEGDMKVHELGDSLSSDRPNEDQVFKVHVEGDAEANTFLGHNVSIDPSLDLVSRIYSNKPRLVTRSKSNNLLDLCSSLINRPSRVGFSPSKPRDSNRSLGVETREVRPEKLKGKVNSGESSQKGDKMMVEVKASLELCKILGLILNEEREVIFNRFVETEKTSGR